MIVPSGVKAGRSRASVSTVVSGRTPSSALITSGSPLRCGNSTGTISSAKTPFFWAAAARWWLATAKASCSCRVMPCFTPCRSVDSPIAQQSHGSVSPSSAM